MQIHTVVLRRMTPKTGSALSLDLRPDLAPRSAGVIDSYPASHPAAAQARPRVTEPHHDRAAASA
jgi:hypothetical protein